MKPFEAAWRYVYKQEKEINHGSVFKKYQLFKKFDWNLHETITGDVACIWIRTKMNSIRFFESWMNKTTLNQFDFGF